RVAAARDPAANAARPVRLAREAITVARSVGDDRVLRATRRSAISALMDLGDPRERVGLNREHVEIAGRLGDASERHRGYGRLYFDLHELGDRSAALDALQAMTRIGAELDRPRYQWMPAALMAAHEHESGNAVRAAALHAEAGRLAYESGDPNAERALLVQAVLIHRDRF